MQIEEIIQAWKQQGIELNNGTTSEQIMMLEKAVDFTFSEQFTKFYLLINGFKNDDWTEGMFSIWPIEKISEEYKLKNNFIPFCDFLIHSHEIGFLKNKPGIFKSYDLETAICLTFNEVLEFILSDSSEVN